MAYLGAETTQLKPDLTRLRRRFPNGKIAPLDPDDFIGETPVVTEVGDNSTPVLETPSIDTEKKTNWVLWIGAAVAVWWFFIRKK